MTTPLIEMPLLVETPEGVIAPEMTVVDVPQPSPDAVARFQAAMEAPLAENARVSRAFADLLPLTQRPVVIESQPAPVVSEKPVAVESGTVQPPPHQPLDEAVVATPVRPVDEKPADDVVVGRTTRDVVEQPVPMGTKEPLNVERVARALPPSLARISVISEGLVVREIVPVTQPQSVAAGEQVVTSQTVVVGEEKPVYRTTVPSPMASEMPVDQTTSFIPSVPVQSVRTESVSAVAPQPIVEVRSQPASPVVDTASPVVGAASLVVGATSSVVDAVSVVPVADESPSPVRETSVVGKESVEESTVRSTTPMTRDVTTDKSVPAEREGTEPDAERLVAAGVRPDVVEAAPLREVAPMQGTEAVAPIAALSAKGPVVRTDVLVEAATAVADALLVSPSLMRGEGEILVQLKPDVLEGSQIRISVQGKTLDVAFQTPTDQMMQLLTTRLPELQQHLVAALPAFTFSVKVAQGVEIGRVGGRKVSA